MSMNSSAFIDSTTIQGRSQDFSKGVSHCVKHYRHGIFDTEYCRLFPLKRLTKGWSQAPQDPPLATPLLSLHKRERQPLHLRTLTP